MPVSAAPWLVAPFIGSGRKFTPLPEPGPAPTRVGFTPLPEPGIAPAETTGFLPLPEPVPPPETPFERRARVLQEHREAISRVKRLSYGKWVSEFTTGMAPDFVRAGWNASIEGLAYRVATGQDAFEVPPDYKPNLLERVGALAASFFTPVSMATMGTANIVARGGLAGIEAVASRLVANGISKKVAYQIAKRAIETGASLGAYGVVHEAAGEKALEGKIDWRRVLKQGLKMGTMGAFGGGFGGAASLAGAGKVPAYFSEYLGFLLGATAAEGRIPTAEETATAAFMIFGPRIGKATLTFAARKGLEFVRGEVRENPELLRPPKLLEGEQVAPPWPVQRAEQLGLALPIEKQLEWPVAEPHVPTPLELAGRAVQPEVELPGRWPTLGVGKPLGDERLGVPMVPTIEARQPTRFRQQRLPLVVEPTVGKLAAEAAKPAAVAPTEAPAAEAGKPAVPALVGLTLGNMQQFVDGVRSQTHPGGEPIKVVIDEGEIGHYYAAPGGKGEIHIGAKAARQDPIQLLMIFCHELAHAEKGGMAPPEYQHGRDFEARAGFLMRLAGLEFSDKDFEGRVFPARVYYKGSEIWHSPTVKGKIDRDARLEFISALRKLGVAKPPTPPTEPTKAISPAPEELARQEAIEPKPTARLFGQPQLPFVPKPEYGQPWLTLERARQLDLLLPGGWKQLEFLQFDYLWHELTAPPVEPIPMDRVLRWGARQLEFPHLLDGGRILRQFELPFQREPSPRGLLGLPPGEAPPVEVQPPATGARPPIAGGPPLSGAEAAAEGRIVDRIQRTIPAHMRWLFSPEEYLLVTGEPEAARISGNVVEAELRAQHIRAVGEEALTAIHRSLSKEDVAGFPTLLEGIRTGSIDASRPPAGKESAYEAAKALVEYFDIMRERVKDYKREMYRLTMPAAEFRAFEAVSRGLSVEEAARAEGVKVEDLTEAIREYGDIDRWGVKDYVTKIELGSYRGVDSAGTTRFVAATRREFENKAVEYFKANPEESVVYREFGPSHSGDASLTVKKGQFWAIVNEIAKAVRDQTEGISSRVAKEAARAGVARAVAIKPKLKFAGPLIHRTDVLKGEAGEDFFDALRYYNYVVNTKTMVDPVALRARNELDTFSRSLRGLPPIAKDIQDLIIRQVETVQGKAYADSRAVDSIIFSARAWADKKGLKFLARALDLPPQSYVRMVSVVRSGSAVLALGLRPFAAMMNLLFGEIHNISMGIRGDYTAGTKLMLSKEGKDLIKDMNWSLGISFSIDTAGTVRPGKLDISWKHPFRSVVDVALYPFSLPEPFVRQQALCIGYVQAKRLGMDEVAARAYAARAVRFWQTIYNLGALGEAFRPPTGRMMLQFRAALANEIMLLRMMGKEQFMRYASLMMAVGGFRAFVKVAQSIPILGSFGILDWVDEELSRHKVTAALYRGVPGFFGVDISTLMAPQIAPRGNVGDLIGPTVSHGVDFIDKVVYPTMTGRGYTVDRATEWAKALPAIHYQWNMFLQSLYSEDGYIRDPVTRNKLYRVDSVWKQVILALGGTPLQISRESSTARAIARDVQVRNELVSRSGRNLYMAIKRGASEKERARLMDLFVGYGGTADSLQAIARNIEMTPKEKQIQRARKVTRPEVYRKWQEVEEE